jgi:hypothetical protein
VQAYMEFERTYGTRSSHGEEKVTSVDARKVRWLVIYGTLQYLHSALRAPNGVRDTESAEYPLCCLIAGQSSWNAETPVLTPSVKTPVGAPHVSDDYFGSSIETSFSIQPDCHREDYFTSQTPVRRSSTMLAPSKASLPTRQASTRSFGPLSSLSARSSRRNSTILRPISHCAIIVHGYGDGLNQASSHTSTPTMTNSNSPTLSRSASTSGPKEEASAPLSPSRTTAAPADSLKTNPKATSNCHTRTRTPLLHSFQLDQGASTAGTAAVNDLMSRSDSTSSMGSSVWTDGGSAASSKSSADSDRQQFYKTSTAAHSGLLGGLISVDGTRVSLDSPGLVAPTAPLSQMDIHPLLRTPPIEQKQGFQFDFGDHSVEATTSKSTTFAVGTAFSAPPSPPLEAASIAQTTSSRTTSLTSEKTILASQSSRAALSLAAENASRKKKRSSDIFSGLVSTSNELRDRYNSAMKRLENTNNTSTHYGDPGSSSKPTPNPPTVTKTSHASKMPSLRIRIWHDDAKDEKKDRRQSSFWRR